MRNKNSMPSSFQGKWVSATLKFCRNIVFFLIIGFSTYFFAQKKYSKEYYKNGNLKEEGWLDKGLKTDYWKFYFDNKNVKQAGFYKNNLKTKYWYFYRKNNTLVKEGRFTFGLQSGWWLFYDKNGNVNHKCQMSDNQKNGYCLIYKNKKLVRASKYALGKKIKEWTDFSSFQRENNLNDLKQ